MTNVFSIRRVLTALWVGLFPLFLLFWNAPVIDTRIRVITLAIAFLIMIGAIPLVWPYRIFRWSLVCFYILLAVFISLPNAFPPNGLKLRAQYCKALVSYAGCPYVWGGEGPYGIDCSGLVRRAMEDALATQGMRTLNPSLLREGISLWWDDTTAQIIGKGYGGRTHFIVSTLSLNDLDYSLLKPGDLAVTSSGIHIMAYLGDKKWIGADPGKMRVTEFSIPESKNAYFFTSMRIMRWKILDG